MEMLCFGILIGVVITMIVVLYRAGGDDMKKDINKGQDRQDKKKSAEQQDKEARIYALAAKLHVKIGG